jgi:hypothetical protein
LAGEVSLERAKQSEQKWTLLEDPSAALFQSRTCRSIRGGDRDRDDGDHDRDRDHNGYRDDNYGSGSGQVVSSSSDDMHRHYCQAETRGGVQLIKQHSDSSCRQGRSWDFDRRGIWVDHGCRADFQVGR